MSSRFGRIIRVVVFHGRSDPKTRVLVAVEKSFGKTTRVFRLLFGSPTLWPRHLSVVEEEDQSSQF